MKSVLVYIIFGFFIYNAEMTYLDMNSFFKVNGDLTKITWAHAVNSQTLLKEALNSTKMMLEADVVIGNITGSNKTNIPIMAHPPANKSDLSVEQFLNTVINHTNVSPSVRKGIKLDFKSIEAFNKSIPIIQTLTDKMKFPVWLNADILSGPGSTSTPVNATRFFELSSNFENVTLSVGWTTNLPTHGNWAYNITHISEMIETLKNNNVNQTVTFPVRAVLAANSIEQMKTLVSNVTNSTLTIWSADVDTILVNVTNLRSLINTIGVNRTFIDVPKDLENQLNMTNLERALDPNAQRGGSGVPIPYLLYIMGCIFAFILNMF